MFGAGYDYTYLVPGIQKVVQAAGRVIRTQEDRGIVYLIDDRFARTLLEALEKQEVIKTRMGQVRAVQTSAFGATWNAPVELTNHPTGSSDHGSIIGDSRFAAVERFGLGNA